MRYDENWWCIGDSIVKLVENLEHIFLEIDLKHTDAGNLACFALTGAVTSHIHSVEIVA